MAELKLKRSSEFSESHKSYSPIKPTCSKIIDRKFDDAIYQHHREKVRYTCNSLCVDVVGVMVRIYHFVGVAFDAM